MSRVLLRTRAAIEDCERHLSLTKAFGTEIEHYLTQHILVVLCAEIQQAIYSIVEERATLSHDDKIRNFVVSSGKRMLRSVQKDEIAKFIGLFGIEAKDKLNSLLNDKEVNIYNNAVSNRHEVAHNFGAQISFGELLLALDAADKILDAVRQALN
jgi:hypothetical protein